MINHKDKLVSFFSSLKISSGMLRSSLIIFVLAAGVLLSLMRYAAKDETGFLIEAATMSDCIIEGRWFGNEAVGWHGFLFKIPAAVLFTIFGRSIFLATFTNVIIAALTCWLCFGILRKLLNSDVWAFAGTWLVITTYHFVICLPTFLRDIPVMFTVLLLISAIINKSNKWIIGICMFLILDAKEGVFFALVPGFVLWVVLSELRSRGLSEVEKLGGWEAGRLNEVTNEIQEPEAGAECPEPNTPDLSPLSSQPRPQSTGHGFSNIFERLFAGLFPTFIFLVLMFCTSVVPLNMLNATVLGLTTSGMHDMKFNFSSKRATKSIKRYMKDKEPKPKPAPQEPKSENRGQKNKAEKLGSWEAERTQKPELNTKSYEVEKLENLSKPNVRAADVGMPLRVMQISELGHQTIDTSLQAGFGFRLSSLESLLATHNLLLTTFNSRFPSFSIYFKKLFFPRTFSFIASPKIIVIPALFMSFVMFRRFWKKSKPELLALPLLLWSYMIIYLLRESHGRYLMPMLPLLALFFAFFMMDALKKRWFPIIVLAICAVMIGFGFKFEIKFVAVKICFNVVLFAFTVLALIGCRRNWRAAKLLALAVPLFTGLFAVGTAFAGSLTQSDGQMRSFFRYGYNMQTDEIVDEFGSNEKFWLNGFASGYVMWFYMDERLTEGERTWRLAKWVPKKHLLRRYDGDQHRRVGAQIRSMERFRKNIMANNVTKVGLVISTYPKQKFSYQDRLEDFYEADWLEFERKVPFKNKDLYIFSTTKNTKRKL